MDQKKRTEIYSEEKHVRESFVINGIKNVIANKFFILMIKWAQ